MNKSRRNQLENLLISLRNCTDKLQSILDDESNALENMPENLQNSERHQKMEEITDILENRICGLNEIISDLEDVV